MTIIDKIPLIGLCELHSQLKIACVRWDTRCVIFKQHRDEFLH